MPGVLRLLVDQMRQDIQEARDAAAVRQQAAQLRTAGRNNFFFNSSTLQLGLNYERERLENPNLRPDTFARGVREGRFHVGLPELDPDRRQEIQRDVAQAFIPPPPEPVQAQNFMVPSLRTPEAALSQGAQTATQFQQDAQGQEVQLTDLDIALREESLTTQEFTSLGQALDTGNPLAGYTVPLETRRKYNNVIGRLVNKDGNPSLPSKAEQIKPEFVGQDIKFAPAQKLGETQVGELKELARQQGVDPSQLFIEGQSSVLARSNLPPEVGEAIESNLGPAGGPVRRSLDLLTNPVLATGAAATGGAFGLGPVATLALGEAGAVGAGTAIAASGQGGRSVTIPEQVPLVGGVDITAQTAAEVAGGIAGPGAAVGARAVSRAPKSIGQQLDEALAPVLQRPPSGGFVGDELAGARGVTSDIAPVLADAPSGPGDIAGIVREAPEGATPRVEQGVLKFDDDITQGIARAKGETRKLVDDFTEFDEAARIAERNIIDELGSDPTVTLYRGIRSADAKDFVEGSGSMSEAARKGLGIEGPGSFWSTDIERARRYAGSEGTLFKVDAKASELANPDLTGPIRTGGERTDVEIHFLSDRVSKRATEVGAVPAEVTAPAKTVTASGDPAPSGKLTQAGTPEFTERSAASTASLQKMVDDPKLTPAARRNAKEHLDELCT